MTTVDADKTSALVEFLCEPSKGEVIADRYTLREVLGTGGMGIVYAARDSQTGEEVAIKVLRSRDRARFEREVKALSALAHPAIVRFVASGVHRSLPYVVMERLEGTTLHERLVRGNLPLREAVELGQRIAEGLAEAHGNGVVHRDLKPSNIFLEDGDVRRAKILDFGIARPVDAATITRRGALVGTPGYMAPEQIRGESTVPPEVDVFALGCVLFECLTGRPAFSGDATENAFARILLEPSPTLRAILPEAPLAVETLLARMLDKAPGARPSAVEAVAALGSVEPHVGESAAGALAKGREPAKAPMVEPGRTIGGKYLIARRIGEGGMGVVYAARHLDLGKVVALKFLRSFEAQSVGRFLREARAASHIESDHVARVLDVGRFEDGTPYLVMEHLEGSDLGAWLAKSGPLACREAVELVLQVCGGVAAAHRLGIVHRDLKPSNLYRTTRNGKPFIQVLDFGISKVTKPLGGLPLPATTSSKDSFVGSVAYASPEQLRDASRADERSDVWAIGVVLYELISGKTPFSSENSATMAARIVGDSPTSFASLGVEVPKPLERVILRCIEKDPGARPETVDALAQELRRAFGMEAETGRGTGEADEPTLPRASTKGSQRAWRWVIVGGASLTVGAAALGALYMHLEDNPGVVPDRAAASVPAQGSEPSDSTTSALLNAASKKPVDADEGLEALHSEPRTRPPAPVPSVIPAKPKSTEAAPAARTPRGHALPNAAERARPAEAPGSTVASTPSSSAAAIQEPAATTSRTAPVVDLKDPALLTR